MPNDFDLSPVPAGLEGSRCWPHALGSQASRGRTQHRGANDVPVASGCETTSHTYRRGGLAKVPCVPGGPELHRRVLGDL